MKKGVYVENLSEETVDHVDEAVALMLRGAANRRVGSTAMNRESSRSHRYACMRERNTPQCSWMW